MTTNGERASKRRKTEVDPLSEHPIIATSEQLHQLFQFSKSPSGSEVKTAIKRFSAFLSHTLASQKSSTDRDRPLAILSKYCKEQSSASHDEVDFPELLSAWSHAGQSNDESTLAAVPSALVQFYEIIEGSLSFRDFGLSLGHSLLKRDQVRLLDKCLSLPKSKDYLIVPALQLLTKLIGFDEGTLAASVFNRRDHLYRKLDAILGSTQLPDERASAAHQSALQFLIANLKYVDTAAKTELITHGKTIYSAIRSLPVEQPDIICQILNTLDEFILDDTSLPERVKSRCFNSGILTALAKLYAYDQDIGEDSLKDATREPVREVLHRFLSKLCTSSCIVNPQSGWYPVGVNAQITSQEDDAIDLGLDTPHSFDEYTEKIPLKNGALAIFLQTLSPGQDVLQAQLVISIFKAAPELVADFFMKKRKFLVQPEDNDATWRGQFAFLFSVVQLSVPKNFGWPEGLPQNPPPLSIAIENILPRPLERSTITKCLQSKDQIVLLSVRRYITVALEKLEIVLGMLDQATSESVRSNLWSQAALKLVALFIERIPTLQEVIASINSSKSEEAQSRASLLECVATYYRVLPSFSIGTKFDIGPLLSQVIVGLESRVGDAFRQGALNEQLTHLLQVGNHSPSTKWWHKATPETLSPFMLLLKFYVQPPENCPTAKVKTALHDILSTKGILKSDLNSFQALVVSLERSKKWQPELVTYEFVENCMTRTMQRPVRYLDHIEAIQQDVSDTKELSLLACCVAEQWPFVIKSGDDKTIKNIAGWIARFFTALERAGENFRVMAVLQQDMLNQASGQGKAKDILNKALEKQRKHPSTLPGLSPDTYASLPQTKSAIVDALEDADRLFSNVHLDLDKTFPDPPAVPQSLMGLTRWEKTDFELEIHSGRLANLIRCLISPSQEVRLQAFHTLHTLTHAVETSNYSEKAQLYLLLGELVETIRGLTMTKAPDDQRLRQSQTPTSSAPAPPSSFSLHPQDPPPSIIAELAIHLLPTISDPSSPLYRPVNEFLLQAPTWTPHRLIPHWTRTTFLTEPSSFSSTSTTTTTTTTPLNDPSSLSSNGSTNPQDTEIHFLLDLLIPSLRSTLDLDLFRRAGIFTRLFSHYMAPVCSKHTRRQILHLVHQALRTPGGADMLITRAGVREWLQMARQLRDHSGHGPTRLGAVDHGIRRIVEALQKEVVDMSDADAIARWERQRPVFRKAEAADAEK